MLFLRDVYVFSWVKMEKRLQKLPKLKKFTRDLNASQVDDRGLNRDLLPLLQRTLNEIVHCEKNLKRLVILNEADPFSCETEWEDLVFGLHQSSQDATKILEDELLCEKLAFVANMNGMYDL
jgi:hypothetical protein